MSRMNFHTFFFWAATTLPHICVALWVTELVYLRWFFVFWLVILSRQSLAFDPDSSLGEVSFRPTLWSSFDRSVSSDTSDSEVSSPRGCRVAASSGLITLIGRSVTRKWCPFIAAWKPRWSDLAWGGFHREDEESEWTNKSSWTREVEVTEESYQRRNCGQFQFKGFSHTQVKWSPVKQHSVLASDGRTPTNSAVLNVLTEHLGLFSTLQLAAATPLPQQVQWQPGTRGVHTDKQQQQSRWETDSDLIDFKLISNRQTEVGGGVEGGRGTRGVGGHSGGSSHSAARWRSGPTDVMTP